MENYGLTIISDQINIAQADMCFSNLMITLSAYKIDHKNHIKDKFEPIPDFRKLLFILFSIKYDINFLNEIGYLKRDKNRRIWGFRK